MYRIRISPEGKATTSSEHNYRPSISYSHAPKFRSGFPLSYSVIALGATLVFSGDAYGQCVPVPPAAVAVTTGTCAETGISHSSNTINTPAINVTGGLYTGNNVTISTTAGAAHGASASGPGRIDLTGGTLTTAGTDADGILATNGGTVTAQNLDIKALANGGSGVVADGAGSSVTLTNTSVSTSGNDASGLWARGGAIVGTGPHHQRRGHQRARPWGSGGSERYD